MSIAINQNSSAKSANSIAPFHYSRLIERILERRAARNPQYSMRSFARSLQISPCQVSRVISGKMELSAAMAEKLAATLFGKEAERNIFCDLVRLGNAEASEESHCLQRYLFNRLDEPESYDLNAERVRCLSDWSVVACFNTFSLRHPPHTVPALARRLGVSPREVEVALAQLLRAGLLERQGSWYQRCVQRFSTPENVGSSVIRHLHRQFLGKALQAVEGQCVNRRYLRSKTIGLSQVHLGRMRELIETFCTEVEKLELLSEGNVEVLYQLNVQLFDLLEPKSENEEDENEAA